MQVYYQLLPKYRCDNFAFVSTFKPVQACYSSDRYSKKVNEVPPKKYRVSQKKSIQLVFKLIIWTIHVRRMRLELTRRNRHYPLKVACLPIPPPAREKVPRTGLEPACLSTHAPETCASTNSATWAFLQYIKKAVSYRLVTDWSGRRDSNPRP